MLVEASFRALYAPGEGIKRTCHVFPDPPASITKSFFSRGPCLESYTLRDRDQQVMVILRAAGWFWERSDRENRDRTELESVLVENARIWKEGSLANSCKNIISMANHFVIPF